jgi:tetratricopeptide (TPR) repeat protein
MKLHRKSIVAMPLLALVFSGCSRMSSKDGIDPCRLVLARQSGGDRLQPQIERAQEQAERLPNPVPAMERLGWLYVAKSRVTSDPGYYKLAELCADCIESRQPGSLEAMLLRGHILHNLHRFKEAEKIARKLTTLRENAFDHGLLGDVLLEQGRLMDAADAYQKMMNLKPSLQAYSRAAHLRWLKGDLAGAIEMMTMAARAGSPRDSESVAWVYTRLALYHLQSGDLRSASAACDAALDYE